MGKDKRNEFWKTFAYFLQMKRYLRLSKKSAVFGIAVPYVYYLYKKRYKCCN